MRAESSIEKAFGIELTKWAKRKGIDIMYLKFVVPGRKGYPDRAVMWGPPFQTIYIEWKRPGEVPDAMQVFIHNEMRALGADVRVYCDHRIALEEITTKISPKVRTIAWDEADRTKPGDKTVSASWKG